MANNFEQMKKIGKEGEAVVESLLRNDDRVWGFEDVSEKDEWQGKDVDFLVLYESDDGSIEERPIEVKTDKKAGRTRNFFVEARIFYKDENKIPDEMKDKIKRLDDGRVYRDGWMLYSEAKYFFFYVPKDKKVYVIPKKELKNFIIKNDSRRVPNYEGNKTVWGWLVPINDLCNNCNVTIYDVIQ